MFIKSYGLFWRIDEVDWNPGKGRRGAFRLLGRRGENQPKLNVVDFRYQQGIYILYGNHGPVYVGLTRAQGLGKRLKDHLSDQFQDRWDRFSWFGYRQVLKRRNQLGLRILRDLPAIGVGDPNQMIRDVEALLIRAMGLDNINQMKFSSAHGWKQIKLHEASDYLKKVARKKKKRKAGSR